MKFIDRVDAVAKKLERFVGGNSANDPLYLTNRTAGQKIRTGVLIGTPVLAIGILIYLALGQQFDRPSPQRREAAIAAANKAKEPTGEMTAKVLPNLDKTYLSEKSKDVDVIEAAVSRGGEPILTGKLRNNTDVMVRVADVVFDITDNGGSQLGGVSVRVENIPPKGTLPFRLALPQATARTALVREVQSR
jgi:hypothetical protein